MYLILAPSCDKVYVPVSARVPTKKSEQSHQNSCPHSTLTTVCAPGEQHGNVNYTSNSTVGLVCIAHGAEREVVIIVVLDIPNTWAYVLTGWRVSCSWAHIMCDPDLIVPPSAGRVRAEYFTNETSYMGLQNALAVVLEQ